MYDNSKQMCKGSYLGNSDPEAYYQETGETYNPPCNWKSEGTHMDVCTTCGAEVHY